MASQALAKADAVSMPASAHANWADCQKYLVPGMMSESWRPIVLRDETEIELSDALMKARFLE